MVPVEEILGWLPGDFHRKDDCVNYHTCVPVEYQWDEVFERLDEDRYPIIFNEIKKSGFLVPVCAQVTEDDHVILLDGHHRLSVALLLQAKRVPVYVGASGQHPADLIALDSGYWTGSQF